MGSGDQHDPKYDDMEVSTTYDEFLQTYNAAALFNDYSSQEYTTTNTGTSSSSSKTSEATYSERTLKNADGCESLSGENLPFARI